ncbi:MAG: putative manganese-dependent inorganic diphosphatase [Bacilli bacterium]|nr:putative manganese-dependent inorganic diphosphatase [Bacilli bacterium]
MKEKVTYVFGHKNPDTDTICAAIALSYLKNKLGFNTIPCTLGPLNSETKFALDYFGFKHPHHLNDVRLQIKDVNYHKNCYIDKNLSIKDAFDYMNKKKLTGISVVENKNKYYGYVSLKEISKEIISGDYHKIDTSYGNLLNLLNGKNILKFDKEISGSVIAATYGNDSFLNTVKLDNSNILIIGDRKTILNYAISNHVKLIVLVANSKITKELLKKAHDNKVNIISTPYTAYEVSKMISLSNYIKNYVRNEEEYVTFNEVDYLSDFLDISKTLKHTNYPILNNKNDCMGILTLTDTNQVDRKKVILVDHNNISQSVEGLDEAEILEVVDHHNVGDISTKKPISFRISVCGSASTIIYNMYKENNVVIPKNIAGLLASAIISDTLLLTSPTTTDVDKEALNELCKISKINAKKYGIELLKAGMSFKGLTNSQLLHKDFKTYKVDEYMIGIGQILTSDIESIKKKFNDLVKFLDEEARDDGYKVLTLFITDIFEKKSYCLFNKSASDIIKASFKLDNISEGVVLPGVVSRKIQIAPYIMDALDR